MAKAKSTKAKGLKDTRLPSSPPLPPATPLRSHRQADLAALEAPFLASFAGADFEQQRKQEIKNGKRRDTDVSVEEVLQRPRKSLSRQQGGRAATTPPAQPPRRQPVTVIFDEGGSAGRQQGQESPSLEAKKNWREFMDSKTGNTGPDTFSSASEFIRERNAAKQQKKRDVEATAEEASEDEAAQATNDRQLSHLLNTTLFARGGPRGTGASSSKDKPDLSSHDTLARILELSSSSQARKGQVFGRGQGAKSLKASQLKTMPVKIREGIRSAAGGRAEKEVERNKEMGLLSDAYSRKLMGRQYEDETMTGKRREKRDRVRGLGMGVGKFRGGILKLSEEEVSRITGEGREGSRGGSSGRGRGVGRASGPDKRGRMK
ncbi:hypothetical protein BCV69DRAFT_282587 [Microstroma glucosiphilum]|uniref:Uncharacterized protein n=1 Tax=Pseudomicrostroma glucosiphilum TaxID=1684307 RepID=A0A316U749_9BASI|nr:hypothetical protein BCV69DRAFT_282587 [Pseudomicrostroma glucosiphilum]PWN21086.1 hypothetical protein BCV69DRAFT_282587 [Pseudomicrostroma glucosiphilum]